MESKKHLKITTLSGEEVYDVLKAQMIKVGYKHLHSPDQADILIRFVKSRYGGYTVAEIDTAFDNAIFSMEPKDIECYEFSTLYFSKIMKFDFAYRVGNGTLIKNTDRDRQSLIDKSPVEDRPVDWDRFMTELVAEYQGKGKEVPLHCIPIAAYDKLIGDGRFKEFEDEASEISLQIVNNLHVHEIKSVGDSLAGGNVTMIAKRLAVLSLFKKD